MVLTTHEVDDACSKYRSHYEGQTLFERM